MGLFKRRSKDLFTVPEPGRATADAEPAVGPGFRMTVDDVLVITGRGAVVTGTVEAGAVAVGTPVTVERAGRPPLAAVVAGTETARRIVTRVGAGDSVGLLFRGVTHGEITTGDVVRT